MENLWIWWMYLLVMTNIATEQNHLDTFTEDLPIESGDFP